MSETERDIKDRWLKAGSRAIVEPESWTELVSDLLSKLSDRGYIWRGQRVGSWELVSSLERAFLAGKVPEDERGPREQRAFSYFRAHAAGYLASAPGESDLLDWLVIMQHYGAPTRLLDWTESPFAATYFAYRDMSDDQEEPAALWAYDTELAIQSLKNGGASLSFPEPRDAPLDDESPRDSWADEINKLVREHVKSRSSTPLPVAPLQPDVRMIAQQTILTVDAGLNGGVPYPLNSVGGFPLLFKIVLPADWRRTVLRELALMGITDAGLFPDIGGVAHHASRIIRDGFRHVRSVLEGH